MGLYFDVRFMPKSTLLLAASSCSAALAAIFIVSLMAMGQRPGPAGARGGGMGMQLVFVLFVAILPMAYMLQPSMLRSIPANYRAEALELRRAGLLGMNAALSLLIALVVKLKISRSEAEAVATSGGRRGTAVLRGRPTVAGKVVATQEAEWIASAGNVAAILSLGLALHLCVGHLNASCSIVFALSPILLLLHQDTGMLAGLTDKQRYFPLVAVSVMFLAASAVFELLLRRYMEQHHWISRSKTGMTAALTTASLVKNLCLLAITLPGHAMFGKFMWYFKHTRDIYWVLLLPLNVLPAVLTDLPAIRLLSALCIAAGCLQLFLSDRIRKHGLQFV